MLAEMPAKLFAEWCTFYQIEPWGTEMDFLRSAIVAHAAASAMGGSRGLKVDDFMPKFKQPKPKTTEELHDIFAQFAGVHNQVIING